MKPRAKHHLEEWAQHGQHGENLHPTHKVCICMHHVNVDDGDGDSKSDGEGAGS